LCEVVDTIRENYVDSVALDVLAAAAVEGIESFATFDQTDAPLECALPDAAFAPVCEALDEADAVPLDGVEAAIDGMIAFALDPNSAYLDPEALALAVEDQTGSVDGIGALVNTEDRTTEDPAANPCLLISDTCRMVIISTFTDSPAERAGLIAGDELEVVDGESVLGKSLDEVTNLVRGPSGSDVDLTFLRGDERFTVTITRAAIEIPIADWQVIGDVGYLQLNLFTNNSDEVVHEALRELVDDGARSLIFDLRNNPGGSLDSSVEIASEFLSDGLVLLTEAPGTEIPYEVRSGGVLTDPSFPVTILVNRGSASASEVVSGALKEAGRAILIGENTFGKNTVQQRFSLSNGGAVKVTIARWVTPSGSDFGEAGISPDIEAEVPLDLTPEEIVAFVNTFTG
jgi:carboxyl-terminal processing protease